MINDFKSGRGGKRPGAGRPKGTTKDISNMRPQHQVRAYEDEWPLVKEFLAVVRKDKERAKRMLKTE